MVYATVACEPIWDCNPVYFYQFVPHLGTQQPGHAIIHMLHAHITLSFEELFRTYVRGMVARGFCGPLSTRMRCSSAAHTPVPCTSTMLGPFVDNSQSSSTAKPLTPFDTLATGHGDCAVYSSILSIDLPLNFCGDFGK